MLIIDLNLNIENLISSILKLWYQPKVLIIDLTASKQKVSENILKFKFHPGIAPDYYRGLHLYEHTYLDTSIFEWSVRRETIVTSFFTLCPLTLISRQA